MNRKFSNPILQRYLSAYLDVALRGIPTDRRKALTAKMTLHAYTGIILDRQGLGDEFSQLTEALSHGAHLGSDICSQDEIEETVNRISTHLECDPSFIRFIIADDRSIINIDQQEVPLPTDEEITSSSLCEDYEAISYCLAEISNSLAQNGTYVGSSYAAICGLRAAADELKKESDKFLRKLHELSKSTELPIDVIPDSSTRRGPRLADRNSISFAMQRDIIALWHFQAKAFVYEYLEPEVLSYLLSKDKGDVVLLNKRTNKLIGELNDLIKATGIPMVNWRIDDQRHVLQRPISVPRTESGIGPESI